jgi:Uncharacterized conserved protein (DUF2190)
MADYTPVFAAGMLPFTSQASATVTGGQVLYASGASTVAPTAGANGAVVGVAAMDAASGAKVTIWPIARGTVHETVTPSGVTAGNALTSSTSGGVDSGTLATIAAAGTLLGTALTTATAGNKCRWTGAG